MLAHCFALGLTASVEGGGGEWALAARRKLAGWLAGDGNMQGPASGLQWGTLLPWNRGGPMGVLGLSPAWIKGVGGWQMIRSKKSEWRNGGKPFFF